MVFLATQVNQVIVASRALVDIQAQVVIRAYQDIAELQAYRATQELVDTQDTAVDLDLVERVAILECQAIQA